MRNLEHIPALGPGSTELQLPPEVNSTSFDYFIYRLSPEPNYSQFADTLHIPQITPSIQKVTSFENEVYVHDDDERAEMLNELPLDKEYAFPMLGKALREDVRAKREKKANQKAQGERFSLISLDLLDLSWETSDPIAGMYESVYVPSEYTQTQLVGYYLPIMEIHTHPDDSLFSPIDYRSLITTLHQDKRYFRGSAVICPNLQLLALATKQTPLVSPRDAQKITADYHEFMGRDLNTKLAEPRANAREIKDAADRYMKEITDAVRPQFKELEAMHQQYNLSPEAAMDAMQAIIIQHTPSYVQDELRFKTSLANAKRVLDDLTSHYINTYLISFARDMHIRLYSSENMTDFTAFSA